MILKKYLLQHPKHFKRVVKANYHTIFCLLSLTGPLGLQAQLLLKQDSLHSLQDKRVMNVYQSTLNPAALATLPQPSYGYAAVTANYARGNFKRPMEAAANTILSLAADGWKKINGWGYKGYFSYSKHYDKDLAWSSVYNAYDHNPLIWADSNSGKWQRDHINAAVAIITPVLLKRGHAGLAVNYDIGSGARTSEPKPFYRFRHITLQPGITWQLNKHQQVGIAGKAAFVQEDNEIGYYSNSNVKVYRLRGFGTYKPLPFVTAERKRSGSDLQAMAHYQKQWRNYDLLISGYIGLQDEKVTEALAKTEITGYFTAINMGAEVVLYTGNTAKGKSLRLSWRNSNGYVDDAVFRAESASYGEHTVAFHAGMWYPGQAGQSSWQWTIMPAFHFIDHTDQATFTQFTTTRIGTDLQLNYRKQTGPKIHLQLQPQAGYHYIADDYFTNKVTNVIIRQLITPDYTWFATSYLQAGLFLAVELQPATSLIHIVSVQANSRLAAANNFNDRTYIQLRYSIIF